ANHPLFWPGGQFEEFVVDDLARFGAFGPKIDAVDRPMRIPKRTMMRMIVLLALGVLDHRIVACHPGAARPDDGIKVNVWRAAINIFGERFSIDLDTNFSIGIGDFDAGF